MIRSQKILLYILMSGTMSSSDGRRVGIVTGGTRGIGQGIATQLAASGEFQGLLLTYNTNKEAAVEFAQSLQTDSLKVCITGGDLSTAEARKSIFDLYDKEFAGDDLCLLVHNAGQYVGVTSDNAEGISAATKKFGDGSLLDDSGSPDLTMMRYYHKLYGEGFTELCEYAAARMKIAQSRSPESYRGSIVGISSPGCNHAFKVTPGYDMPGSGKCLMEFSCRLYALELASLSINVNVVIPGVTRSDAWGKLAEKRGLPKDAMLTRMEGMVPRGEIAEATDIGDMVVFLSGKGGGRLMTGLSLRVDGGLHLK